MKHTNCKLRMCSKKEDNIQKTTIKIDGENLLKIEGIKSEFSDSIYKFLLICIVCDVDELEVAIKDNLVIKYESMKKNGSHSILLCRKNSSTRICFEKLSEMNQVFQEKSNSYTFQPKNPSTSKVFQEEDNNDLFENSRILSTYEK